MKTIFATQLLTASVLGLQLTSWGKQGRSEENLPEMRPDNDHIGNFDLAQLGAEYTFTCSEPFDRLNG